MSGEAKHQGKGRARGRKWQKMRLIEKGSPKLGRPPNTLALASASRSIESRKTRAHLVEPNCTQGLDQLLGARALAQNLSIEGKGGENISNLGARELGECHNIEIQNPARALVGCPCVSIVCTHLEFFFYPKPTKGTLVIVPQVPQGLGSSERDSKHATDNLDSR